MKCLVHISYVNVNSWCSYTVKMVPILVHLAQIKLQPNSMTFVQFYKGLSQLKKIRGVNVFFERLLKPMTFLGTLGPCKMCLES